jgi:hypothetical protein
MSEAKQSDSTDLLGQFLEAAKEAGVTRLIPTHPEDIRAALDAKDAEIRQLRQLLAVRVAGAMLYADDGELQDNTQNPCIDFRRDKPSEIQRKLQERGLANYRRSLEDEARSLGA